MSHGAALNREIRKAGIVWHECCSCARDWPFPKGIPPEVSEVMHEAREWKCHVCVQAAWADLVRATAEQLPEGTG